MFVESFTHSNSNEPRTVSHLLRTLARSPGIYLPPQCWDCKHEAQYLAFYFFFKAWVPGIELRYSYWQGKHFAILNENQRRDSFTGNLTVGTHNFDHIHFVSLHELSEPMRILYLKDLATWPEDGKDPRSTSFQPKLLWETHVPFAGAGATKRCA